jgi:hypothetical protein
MMKLNDLSPVEGSRKNRKRVGRGPGSGHGRTACRGSKGQKASLAGVSVLLLKAVRCPCTEGCQKEDSPIISRRSMISSISLI